MSFTLDHHLYGPMPYRKARTVSLSSSSGFHSQRRRPAYSQPQQSSADSLDSFGGDMARRNEKEILQTLNDRFAGYIDKVRNLELLNRNLEAEADSLRQSQAGRASVGEHYDRELGDLRGLVQQLTGEKARAVLEHEHLEEDILHARARLEDEARNREEMEAAARAMNKYVDECGLARLELDKKLRALQEEVAFLKKNHEEEVADLLAQMQGAQVNFEVRDTMKADVTSALREIRAQLDGHASKSATQAEEWFSVRMDRLSTAARGNTDAIRSIQEEIAEYRRQLQSRTIELETLRGIESSLERQRLESEDRHHGDLNSLQENIHQLDNELKSTKWEMASQLREYQELLNVKMALDIEIAAYRKLLEGEESRFFSGPAPYSYLKLKAEELSDTVIVEEQTDETQVTEVTEDADEEEGEKEDKEEGDEEEGDDTKAEEEEEEGEEVEDKKEEDGEGAEEKGEEEEEAGGEEEEEEKSKSPEKAASPPSKSPPKTPEPKSPAVKSPESKSPKSKSPESKSPESKSPKSKSPESKSPESKSPMPKSPAKSPAAKSPTDDKPKSPEPKSPVTKDAPEEKKEMEQPEPVKEEKKEKEQPEAAKEKEEKKEKEQPEPVKEKKEEEKKKKEQSEPAKEEKKEKEQPEAAKEKKEEKKVEKKEKEQPEPVKEEKKPEPKEKEKPESKAETDKPDTKKESKAEETPKKADTPKPSPAAKPAEDKPAPKSTPKESPAPAKKEEEKASPPKTEDKPKAEEKPSPKVAAPEKTESKKDEKKTEEKKEKESPKAADSKEDGGKTDKKKSSSTEAKVSKEEKAKK